VKKVKTTEAAQEAARGVATGAETEAETEAATLVPREVTLGDMNAMILRRFFVLDKAVARLDAKVDAGFARMNARIDGLETQIWEIKEQLAQEDENDETA